MQDLARTAGIEDIIRRHGSDPQGNFESVYSSIHKSGDNRSLGELDKSIRTYFERIEIQDEMTIYDFLVLSLRSKDVIVSFNWDPLLPQAFRRWRKLGNVLPELVFPHGNVDVGLDRLGKSYAFLVDQPTFEPTRLLYPVEQKDYNSDPFIVEQWNIATSLLARAYCVTIFGYSAPATDVEARGMLLQAWTTNPTYTLGKFEIIDIRQSADVEKSWSDFTDGSHGGVLNDVRRSALFWHPRRTCEAFAFASLQQRPWREDPFPTLRALPELEDWIMPLINEEASGKLIGNPHH